MRNGTRRKLLAERQHDGLRLDQLLAAGITECSRSFLRKLIEDGAVEINGETCEVPRRQIKTGESVLITIPDPEPLVPEADDFDFEILYEDDVMLVIDKPAGVVVHPAPGNTEGTVVNALLGRYPALRDSLDQFDNRPGIVHRLDKDTSGVLVVAKTPESQFALTKSFAEHKVSKTYLAIVRGVPEKLDGEIRTLIGRHPVNRKKMAVVDRNGKEAITCYHVTDCGYIGHVPVSILEVDILTGRTHQIRVHMAHIGHPVIGDELYGGGRTGIEAAERQMLHAYRIRLPHPVTGETLKLKAKIPDDFQAMIDLIEDEPGDIQ
ncbi:MAG: RluA family pseudouridine synthase [Victivallaceae bacterium]|nr:RluA family pseudouridine synthase [Victivallaceae bacterium]